MMNLGQTQRSWLAMALMLAVAFAILWPDAAMAQTEGADIITGFSEWILNLFRRGGILFLILAIFGLVVSAAQSNVTGVAISAFFIALSAAVIYGSQAAIERIAGGGGL